MLSTIGVRKTVHAAALMVACVFAACVLGLPSTHAWAASDASGPGSLGVGASLRLQGLTVGSEEDAVAANGGWQLSYVVEDGKATITGVAAAPNAATDLVVPSKAGGCDVVAVAPSAFYECDALGAVILPSTLSILGENAFKSSSITAIELPASLAYVPYQCFRDCTGLKEVSFADGCTPEYLGTRAFYNCSSLTEIQIPALNGADYRWICENPTSTFDGHGSWRVGYQCFSYCTKLAKVVLLPGNATGIRSYFKDGGMQFGNNASGMVIVNYCEGATSRYSSTAKWYFAVNFYKSRSDAEADPTRIRPWKRMMYPAEINLLQILKGTTSSATYAGSDELPDVKDTDAPTGYVWGVDGGVMTSARTTLNSTVNVYPVDRRDMAYGWVTSPEIEAYAKLSSASMLASVGENGAYVRLPLQGSADVSHFAAYAADGTVLDVADYGGLKYEIGKSETRNNYVYSPLNAKEDITQEGRYRVYAVGSGEFAKTETPKTEFNVRRYQPVVSEVVDSSANNSANLAIEKAVRLTANTPSFSVVASGSVWQNALVASGLAGAGGGQAVLVDGDSTSAAAYRAIQASESPNVIFLDSSSIENSVMSKVRQNVGAGGHYDAIEGTTPEALSLAVYKTVREYGPQQANPYDWGDTAVVVSGTRSFGVDSVALYAYQAKAPVFFTDAAGSVGADTLAALKSGGFSSIVVAGDESYVPASALDAIVAATGITPTRVLASSVGSAYSASKAFVDELQAAFVDDLGNPINRTAGVVVADARDSQNVIGAAQLAAAAKCSLLAVSSSADVKAVEECLAQTCGDLTDIVYLVGDFSTLDPSASNRMASVWSTPMSTTVGKGDTVESGGLLYELTSGTSAALAALLDDSLTQVSSHSVKVGSASYSVDSIASNAFAQNAALESVSSSAKTIGSNAFAGCSSLKTANLPNATSIGQSAFTDCSALASVDAASAKTISASAFKNCKALAAVSGKTTAIGASAFEGCKALKTATFAQATSIGNRAFYGCSKLQSANVAASKTIGASAFSGCSKLKSISTNATSIGESAFSGCSVMASAKLGSTALAKINDSTFYNCRKLSSVTIASTSLNAVGANAFRSCAALKNITLKSKKLKSIGASAFASCATLKSASFVSTALASLGKQAFTGCKKLASLTFKSAKIKTVGAKAFNNVYAKAVVAVPKAKLASYKKLFQKAGLPKKATVKKG